MNGKMNVSLHLGYISFLMSHTKYILLKYATDHVYLHLINKSRLLK